MNFVQIIFKYSVSAAEKAHCISITKSSRLDLYGNFAVYYQTFKMYKYCVWQNSAIPEWKIVILKIYMFWRWYISRAIKILDSNCGTVFYLKQIIRDRILPSFLDVMHAVAPRDIASSFLRTQSLALSDGPNWVDATWRRRKDTFLKHFFQTKKTEGWKLSWILIVLLMLRRLRTRLWMCNWSVRGLPRAMYLGPFLPKYWGLSREPTSNVSHTSTT